MATRRCHILAFDAARKTLLGGRGRQSHDAARQTLAQAIEADALDSPHPSHARQWPIAEREHPSRVGGAGKWRDVLRVQRDSHENQHVLGPVRQFFHIRSFHSNAHPHVRSSRNSRGPARECARGWWIGWDQAGRFLRDFLRIGSLESKRAERPNVL